MNAAAPIRPFFSLLFAGQQQSAQALVGPAARSVASRPESGGGSAPNGTYAGREGMAELARRLGEVFEPGGFEIEASFAEGPQVALHGRLNTGSGPPAGRSSATGHWSAASKTA